MNNKAILLPIFALGISFVPGLPYGYFQLLRWIVCISAGITAYRYRAGGLMILFALVVILFNPIAKEPADKAA